MPWLNASIALVPTMLFKMLSAVIPCYNESDTIEFLVEQVLDADSCGMVGGDMAIIRDADLEYQPGEYPNLPKPIIDASGSHGRM